MRLRHGMRGIPVRVSSEKGAWWKRLRRMAKDESGMTMFEVLISVVLLTGGLIATFGTFATSGHLTITTQRQQAAYTAAEQQMETLRAKTYSTLALSSLPSHTTDGNSAGDTTPSNPSNPDYWVSGTSLTIPSSFTNESSSTLATESMISGGTISPGPTTVTTNGYTVNVYTFITYVNDSCVYGGTDKCSSTQDAKRIVVAAKVPSSGYGQGTQKPVWLSTIVANPAA